MVAQKQSGFSLIEITLVLAISGALLGIAVSGLSGLQGRLHFTGAVDIAKEDVLKLRTDAQSSINEDTVKPGENPALLNYGRLAVVTPTGLKIYTLTTANTDTPLATQIVTATPSPQNDVTFDYGLAPTATNTVSGFAFTRSLTDGHLQTAGFSAPINLLSLTYGTFIGGGSYNIKLNDAEGHLATIAVSTSDNGVTRSFQ